MLILALSLAHAAPVSLTAGYNGDFVSHPGGYVGLTTTLAESGPFSFRVGADLGAYHHHRNHTGAFLRPNLATRIQGPRGGFFEPRFVAGYLHTWVGGGQYWVEDSVTGESRRVVPAGSANLTWGVGLGAGWQADSGLSVVIRPELLARAPYNSFALAQLGLQAGIEIPVGGGR